MKFLANENFPHLAVNGLRSAGYDVIWARTDMTGKADDVILQRAQDENRIVVTFDKDFGELAYRWGLPSGSGVILFRLVMQSPEHVRDRVAAVFSQHAEWIGNFTVVEEHRIRVRPLPQNRTD
ncbi:MAG: DUF5615 family PIN-like protein [Planctomycetales bacterium]|nr:DUF5615 family PIN-like protein [Planctomycetales bacterium]